jgi:hypothetical protein
MVKSKKSTYLLASIIIFLFLFFLTIGEASMLNYKIVCGKYVREYRVKSTWYCEFEIEINGRKRKVSRGFSCLKIKDEKTLKKFDCIKIAYSTYINSNIRVIDKRVGKEWIWFLKKEDK